MAVEAVQRIILKLLQETSTRPLFVGINGPQGSGKSYICAHLPYITISLDDLYLPSFSETNELLRYRGLPGTHDIGLGVKLLDQLRIQQPTKLPHYDKSANNGRGARLPESEWTEVFPPYDVILIEGWCLGFKKTQITINPAQYQIKFNKEDMDEVNNNVEELDLIHEKLDYFIQIKANDIQNVFEWRWEQEVRSILHKGAGLTQDECRDFIERFMPCYDQYLPGLEHGILPTGKNAQIAINKNREIQDIVYF